MVNPLAQPQMTNNLGGSFFNQSQPATPSTFGGNTQNINQGASPFVGAIVSGLKNIATGIASANPMPQNPITAPAQSFNFAQSQSPVVPTSTGGLNFANAHPSNLNPAPGTVIGSDASRTYNTPNNGTVSVGANGGIASSVPAPQYNIDLSSPTPSNALNSGVGLSTIQNKYQSMNDQLQGLANNVSNAQLAVGQASQYSPAYAQAFQAQNEAQANQAMINANLATGNGLTGYNTGQAQTITGQQQALNTQQATEAGINLNTQQLIRTGNITAAQSGVSAAQSQLQYSPTSLMAQNAISSVNSLSNQYPGAGILPTDTIEQAQQKVNNSSAYQSQFLTPISLPGGGLTYVNKNQIVTDPTTGQAQIVSPGVASQAQGYSSSIQQLQNQLSPIQAGISTADQNFPLLLQTVKATGINDFTAPLANQLQQKVSQGFSSAYAPYNALVQSLQATYSGILARNGSVTDTTRNEAAQMVNGTLGYNGLVDLYKTLKQESANVVSGYQNEINSNTASLEALYKQGGSSTGGGASATDPLGIL